MSFYQDWGAAEEPVKLKEPGRLFSASEVFEAKEELLALFADHRAGVRTKHVGSTYINDSFGKDLDILVYVDPNVDELNPDEESEAYEKATCQILKVMEKNGWTPCGNVSEYSTEDILPFRKGDINALITVYHAAYTSFCRANQACRYLKLQGIDVNKAMRKKMHAIIMDGESA